MTKIITLTVVGSHEFPIDMLRFDSCWPKTGDDAEKIRKSFGASSWPEYEVTLQSNFSPPTVKRWNSFGFAVKSCLL